MLHFSINAVIYYGESLELSDPIQISFLGANWGCQFDATMYVTKCCEL